MKYCHLAGHQPDCRNCFWHWLNGDTQSTCPDPVDKAEALDTLGELIDKARNLRQDLEQA